MLRFKFLTLVLAVVFVLSVLSACGTQQNPAAPAAADQKTAAATEQKKDAAKPADTQTSEKKFKIGVTYQNLQNEYIEKLKEFADAKAKEMGVDIIHQDGQGKAETQISQVENFLAQKVDAVILSPFDKDGCAPIVTMCNNAKVPIILMNSQVTNMDQATSFVGSDDVDAGTIAMTAVAEAVGGKGNITLIHGPMGHSAEISRTIGVKNVLKKYPDMKIVAEQPADWDRAKGMALAENWLQSKQQLVAIVGENDEMALGAMKAVEAAGKLKDIKIVGVDAVPDALQAVKDGKMLATVFQDAKGQAQTAVDLAVKAAKGEKLEKKYFIPFKLVNKDNIAEYLK